MKQSKAAQEAPNGNHNGHITGSNGRSYYPRASPAGPAPLSNRPKTRAEHLRLAARYAEVASLLLPVHRHYYETRALYHYLCALILEN